MTRCFCGCGKQTGLQLHHVVYQQELRRVVREEHKAAGLAGPPDIIREMTLRGDVRNMVPVGRRCHAAHHNRSKPYELRRLPDSAFEFAAELMGTGRAYEYLRRRYAGDDARLDALLSNEREAA
jgi:hypothetical protein